MKRSCNTEWDHHNNLIWGPELGSKFSHKSLQGYIQTPHLTESTLRARVSHRIVMYPESRSLFSTCSWGFFCFCFYFLIFCCYSSVSKLSYEKNWNNLLPQSPPFLPSLSSHEWFSSTDTRATYNHHFQWQPIPPFPNVTTGETHQNNNSVASKSS